MKLLVTGHKGFIGSNFLKWIPDHDITTFEWGDCLPNVEGMDWVVHFGAISSTLETDVEKVLTQNLDFSVWLLEECIKHKVNLQYSSSASVYGKGNNFREDAKVDPRSPYAWSKYLFERHVTRMSPTITVQGFRYFNVYGPGEDHKGNMASPFHKFKKEYEETGHITLYEGSENYFRDFVPVEVVCSVHESFLNIKESGIWNVGLQYPLSFKEVALTIAPEDRIKYVKMPDNMKNSYQAYTCADLSKLNRTLLNN